MGKIYDFLRSLKLAIVLILYITATSILSTFIPADLSHLPPLLSGFIATMGFDHFFSSPLFLLPVSLFFLNLLVCTIHRIRTRLVRKARRRFGPDILHIGLLVMIIGGVVSAVGRQEGGAWLNIGDKVSVPGGYVMYLTDFQFLTYENGSPKDWISTVRVEKNGKPFLASFSIEVNKPLKLGNAKIYQASYKDGAVLKIKDKEGKTYSLSEGEMIPSGDEALLLKKIGGNSADFERWKDHKLLDKTTLSPGDQVAGYTIVNSGTVLLTGLKMVIDPGYYPVLFGLLLLALGIFTTYIQKIGDSKL